MQRAGEVLGVEGKGAGAAEGMCKGSIGCEVALYRELLQRGRRLCEEADHRGDLDGRVLHCCRRRGSRSVVAGIGLSGEEDGELR